MAQVLARLKTELPEEGFKTVEQFLEDVVESLKQQGGGGGAGGEVGERLAAALPAVKALAGWGGD